MHRCIKCDKYIQNQEVGGFIEIRKRHYVCKICMYFKNVNLKVLKRKALRALIQHYKD